MMYQSFYPYAVQVIAVIAALGSLACGAYCAKIIASTKSSTKDEAGYEFGPVSRAVGAGFAFIGSCVAAMIILRVGLWATQVLQH